jgi:hypothetical protein
MTVRDELQHQKNEENIQKVRKVINSNHRLTVREVADEDGIHKTKFHEILDEDGIYKTTFHEILTEHCGMHRVAANFVPRLLGEQIQNIVCMSVKGLSTVQMLMITF